MDTPEKNPKTKKQGIESDDKSKRSSEEISRMIHPHDDEPDPTAYMGNYNFPQMLFAFCLGCATIFVAAVNEIDKFKGCPLPAYFDEPRSTVR
tara:strand:- start:730 stop:1008 length:279 start_codon:yes stop_codon:yes gene_type:complete